MFITKNQNKIKNPRNKRKKDFLIQNPITFSHKCGEGEKGNSKYEKENNIKQTTLDYRGYRYTQWCQRIYNIKKSGKLLPNTFNEASSPVSQFHGGDDGL